MIAGVAVPGTGTDPAAAAKALALKKSVIDGALDNASSTRARLSVADQQRMDEFLTAVRETEMKATQVSMGMGGAACALGTKPTMATVTEDGIRQTTSKYNKGDHADAMNALIVMALQCDVTRIIVERGQGRRLVHEDGRHQRSQRPQHSRQQRDLLWRLHAWQRSPM
jgi:hypothetical protein